MKTVKQDKKKDAGLGCRDLMKIGAGAVIATLSGGTAIAQEGAEGARAAASGPKMSSLVVGSGAGYIPYKNTAKRISGNGPMDGTTRKLVDYTLGFSESAFRDNMVRASYTMLDTITAHMAGFESEPARISARMGMMRPASEKMKSTIMGYGITTSPEQAAFANSFMIRQTDYNDSTPAGPGHASTIIGGVLAVGEAFHCTGSEVLCAVALGYEVLTGLSNAGRVGGTGEGGGAGFDGPYDLVAVALACGKLLKLDDDRLANAVSLAFVPHLPMSVSHTGVLTHWKAGHQSMAVSSAVYAALMAKEGMTGPSQPFEQRSGWFEHIGGAFKELRLPYHSDYLAIEHNRMKEYPAEGSTQGILDLIPSIRETTKASDVESINVEVGFGQWQEIASPAKWDPQNRETADHSLAYLIAVALIDGEIYLDAFKPERYLHDTAVRDLMNRITIRPNTELRGKDSIDGSTALDEVAHITIKKKSGETLVKDSLGYHNPTNEDAVAKFKRVCEYRSVSPAQRDKALATWPNLKNVKDIADPIRDLAKYGKPMPV